MLSRPQQFLVGCVSNQYDGSGSSGSFSQDPMVQKQQAQISILLAQRDASSQFAPPVPSGTEIATTSSEETEIRSEATDPMMQKWPS